MDYGNLARLKVTVAGEKLMQTVLSAAAGMLGTLFGGRSLLTGYTTTALKKSDMREDLSKVTDILVGRGSVEFGNIDPETLVPSCVYDDLLLGNEQPT